MLEPCLARLPATASDREADCAERLAVHASADTVRLRHVAQSANPSGPETYGQERTTTSCGPSRSNRHRLARFRGPRCSRRRDIHPPWGGAKGRAHGDRRPIACAGPPIRDGWRSGHSIWIGRRHGLVERPHHFDERRCSSARLVCVRSLQVP